MNMDPVFIYDLHVNISYEITGDNVNYKTFHDPLIGGGPLIL